MLLHRFVNGTWVDPWGRPHPVDQLAETVDVILAGRFPMNNGYDDVNERVAVAADGRTFIFHSPTDFGVSGHWTSKTDGKTTFWRERLTGRIVDADGNPITASIGESTS